MHNAWYVYMSAEEEIIIQRRPAPRMGKFSSAIYMRIHVGLNSILLVLGARGIGKSYIAMKIGEKMSHGKFSVDDVVFNMEEFLERLKFYEEKRIRWGWIVFDEVGLEIPAREFMKIINKVMSYVAQSFRKTAINLLVVVPHPSMVDLHIRSLADFWVVMKQRGVARIYQNKMNPFRDKPQTPFLNVELEVGLPSKELCEAYEAKRTEYLSGKYDQYLKEVKHEKEKRQLVDLEERALILSEIKAEFREEKLKKNELGYEIMTRLNLSQAPAYHLRKQILRDVGEAEEKSA